MFGIETSLVNELVGKSEQLRSSRMPVKLASMACVVPAIFFNSFELLASADFNLPIETDLTMHSSAVVRLSISSWSTLSSLLGDVCDKWS